MATNPISFTNTPQAGDDNYTWTETQLQASTAFNTLTNTITLNVMSNDLGGAAKKLWSIQDVNGNSLDNGYSVMKDGEVFSGVSAWETTDQGNQFRIANGQIEYKIIGDINALGEGDSLHDVFNYTIRLANGTLSEARVTVHVDGVNDLATISGTTTGAVTEDSGDYVESASITVSDLDAGENELQPTSGTTAHGSYNVTTGGWSYTADNSTLQSLGAGVTATDSFTISSEDGTDSETVSITLTGVNDTATISGTTTGAVTEDSGDYSESASITVSDVDTGENELTPGGGSTAHGSYTVSTTGWSYTADNTALQSLGAGVTATDSFTISSEDGSDSETVSITLTGVNDAATISGTTTGAVTEDSGDYSESASMTVSDADAGENELAVDSDTTTHGSYVVTGSGWSYTADNTALQSLGAGVTATDSFTISSEDGTDSETVSITLTGVNDTATISGTLAGAVTEDSGDYSESASITVSDVDTGENELTPGGGSTAHGSYTVSTTGWSYTADNSTLQSLGAGVTATDSFTISSEDGTDSETVSITLTGVNDLASISGTLTGAITEDSGDYSESATITVSDADTGQNVLQATSGSTAHGTYNVTAGGWSFTADNGTLQSLNAGVTATDSFTITSADGTDSETVVITFHGVADGDPDDNDDLVTSPTPVIMTPPGPSGANTILGSTGDDTLYGGAGNDTMYGGAGNDYINGEGGADSIFGGSGNDTLVGDAGVDAIYGGSGNDSIDAGASADVLLFGGLGDDTIRASDGADVIATGDGNDTILVTTVASGFATDTVTDFNTNAPGSPGDVLDVSAVLDLAGNTWGDGGSLATAVSGGFITFQNVGGNVGITVDANGSAGGGPGNGQVVVLQGVAFTSSGALTTLLNDNIILG